MASKYRITIDTAFYPSINIHLHNITSIIFKQCGAGLYYFDTKMRFLQKTKPQTKHGQYHQSRTRIHVELQSQNVTHFTGQTFPHHQPMPMNSKATHWPLVFTFKSIMLVTTNFELEPLFCNCQLLLLNHYHALPHR